MAANGPLRDPEQGAPAPDRAPDDGASWRFARTMAAAGRSRETGEADSWDRAPLPEEMRRILREEPSLRPRWRRLLDRLSDRAAWARRRPASAPILATPPPRPQTMQLPRPGAPNGPAAMPVSAPAAALGRAPSGDVVGLWEFRPDGARPRLEPAAPLPARATDAPCARRIDPLALRFWPEGKAGAACASKDARIDRPEASPLSPARAPVTTRAPGLPARSLQLHPSGDGWRAADAGGGGAADGDAAGAPGSGRLARLARLGCNRHVHLCGAMLILLALVAHETLPARLDGWWPRPDAGPSGPARAAGEVVRGELGPPVAPGTRAQGMQHEARSRDLEDPVLLFRWGQALEQLGELEQALAKYRRAAELSLGERVHEVE